MVELFFCGINIVYYGNPRVKTCFILKRNGKVIIQGVKIIQKEIKNTNNSAQYYGLIEAILFLRRLNIKERITVYNDNAVLCNIISKKWGWNKRRTIWCPHKKCNHLRVLLKDSLILLDGIDCSIVLITKRKNLATYFLLIPIFKEKHIICPRRFINKKEWKSRRWKRDRRRTRP